MTMQVEAILQSKGTTVHTVPVHAQVRDAVATLNKHNIGAVVVVDGDGEVAGILSERDVVRLLGSDPADALQRPVRDCMTAKIITCTRDTTIAQLMEQMTHYRIRHIPIVEDGDLKGIVSIGDVVKRKIEETEQEASALREYIAT
jgi:CBS domain-containing protein